MSPDQIEEVLRQHSRWARNLIGGKKADFSCCNLRGFNFSGERLVEVEFIGADLEGASFEDCLCNDICFRFANLKNASFTRTTCRWGSFKEANLTGAKFTNSDISYCYFRGADLSDAKLVNTTFAAVKLPNCNIDNIEVSGERDRTDLGMFKAMYNSINNIRV